MRENLSRRKVAVSTELSLSMTEMFEEFMLVKKGEGLAKRTIREHYNNFGYFKDYINRELLADEMTTELFMCWITFMREEMDYSPMAINIRVRTMRAFLRYCYEDKARISEPIHKRFKPINAPIDVVAAYTVEEYRRLIAAIDDENYVGFRTKIMTYVLLDTMVRVCELVDIKRQNFVVKTMVIRLEAADTKTRIGRMCRSHRVKRSYYENICARPKTSSMSTYFSRMKARR
ncbi:phage integrase SAM-like domain-containing protein [Neobacillus drentensis]|uniref:tyrosine-type recombinase/integrase n=1 Tax=Neobacillus drentensis TaxID=220684 RepID=UPI003000C16A